VGCNIMCGALALKIAISLKNGEQKNWKIINTQSFLTILFVSQLLFNNNKRAAEGAVQKLVCGLWCHVWCVGTEISISIKKLLSMRTKKSSTLNHFSPFFSRCCCFLIIVSGRRKQRGKNWSVGCNIRCGALALKTAISLKTQWAWELWKFKEEIDSYHSFGVAYMVWWLHV
jgi:hypothetical protein